MTREKYAKLMKYWADHPSMRKKLIIVDSVITKAAYVVYPLLLIWLICRHIGVMGNEPVSLGLVLKAVLVPGISFVVLSVFRYYYCAQRPYEKYGIPPAIPKDTKGKSFPSRHVFSCFVIAMTALFFIPPVGMILLLCGIVMAAVRVAGGVHFPADVIVGGFFGIISGIVGFWVI